jgi:predicted MPP superfamily phosphohydrolase
VSLPFIGTPIRYGRDFKYVQGLYEKNGTQLYVSAGTGVIGLPVRLGVRPEISILKLRRN